MNKGSGLVFMWIVLWLVAMTGQFQQTRRAERAEKRAREAEAREKCLEAWAQELNSEFSACFFDQELVLRSEPECMGD
jgi:hypothetical protein